MNSSPSFPVPLQRDGSSALQQKTPGEVWSRENGEVCQVRLWGANEKETAFLRDLIGRAQATSLVALRFQLRAASAGPGVALEAKRSREVALVVADSAHEAGEMSRELNTPFLAVLRGDDGPASASLLLEAGAGDCLNWDELSAPLLQRALRLTLQSAPLQRQLDDQLAGESGFLPQAPRPGGQWEALEHLSLGVMLCGLPRDDCPILWVNPAMEAITGFPASEMLGRNPRFLGGEGTDRETVSAVRLALREERHVQVTLLNFRRDQTPFWNEINLSPLRDAAGAVSGWIGTLSDVTGRVEGERALHESQRDLEFSQRLSHLGSWWIALGQGVELWHARAFWSDELYRIVGVEPGEILSSPHIWDSFVHPDDRARVRDFMESLEVPDAGPVSTLTPTQSPTCSIEYRLRLRDGSEKWVQCDAEVERDAQGRKTRIMGIILDISERVRDAEALRASQRRTRALLRNAPLLLWSLDSNGTITSIQGQAMSSIGLRASELVGRAIFEAMGEEDAVVELARRALGGEECEGAMWFKDRYLAIRYAPLPEGGALGVGVDMTETEGARQKWLDSQRQFQSIVANVPGVVYRFTRSPGGELGFEFVSPRARAFWRQDINWQKEGLGPFAQRMLGEDYRAFLLSIEESARTLSPWSWRGRLFDEAQGVRCMHALSQPFRREDGTIVWDGLILDETESVQARLELERSRAALEEAQEIARLGSFDWNLKTGQIKWSPMMFRIYGFEPNEFSPDIDWVRERMHPDDLSLNNPAFNQRPANEVALNMTDGSYLVRIRRKDGQERFLQTHSHLEPDEAGQPARLVGLSQDVTEQILAGRALRESEERYALSARGANDGLWDWDLERDTMYLSPRWNEMIGCSACDTIVAPRDCVERVHPDDRASLEASLQAHLSGQNPHFEAEFRLRHEGGEWVWMLGRGLAVRDESGRALRIAGSQTDISGRKRFEAQLAHSAFYDALTGLPNRVLFNKQLERALASAAREPDHLFAVLFLDLDRFKVINDSLGHIVGDQVLVEAGRRFASCVRPGDTVARLGGDEFAVLLDGVADAGTIETIATRMSAELELPFLLDGREVFVTVSIGVAPFQGHDTRAVDLLRNADTAMYRAKGAGRARHTLFDHTMHQSAVRLLELESDLWRALERDELRLHFQPIVALESGQVHGFEALVRWQHPERGLVSPGEFIPLAEETGLIMPIGWWVLEQACRQGVKWNSEADRPLAMAVNLSSQSFSQTDFVAGVREVLGRTGFDPRLLTLEITESVLMKNTESASAMLRQLRAMGVTLAMDDFGTGYSSLSYLHRFSLDVLKVDRSFVAQLSGHGKNQQIVDTILHLARGLGMRAVAEGIESEEQLRLIRHLGCQFAQGFYFARPLASEGIEGLLAQNPCW